MIVSMAGFAQADDWPNAQMIRADFNGDGKIDLIVHRPSDGSFAKWYAGAATGPDFNYQAVRKIGGGGWGNSQLIPMDFNGDGKMDILVYRPSDGSFAKWYSSVSVGPDFNYQAVRKIGSGGWENSQLIPMDFNADGKMDLLVYRPSDGSFAKWYSGITIGPDFNYQAVRKIGGGGWGNSQLIPMDFDADGKMDLLVHRLSDGSFAKWYSDSTTGPDFNYQAVRKIGG